MDDIIEKVRSPVLQLVSQQDKQLFDDHDTNIHVRTRDAFIRMFCDHYAENHRGKHDVEVISQRMVETLKWRKSFGLTSAKAEDFPLELWQRNPYFVHEDEDYFILVYILQHQEFISQRWSDLSSKFTMFIHSKWSLEAVHAGKKLIAISDTSRSAMTGMIGMDKKLHSQTVHIMDTHFPKLATSLGVYGLPWIIVPFANFFMRFIMPRSLKKVFKFYTEETIGEMLDEKHLPIMFGGKLPVRDVMEHFNIQPRSMAGCPEDWGLQEWEVRKVIESNKT